MKDERDIDRIFKDGLENPDIPYNDQDWEALSNRLNSHDEKSLFPIYWITAIASIAAILIIAFFLVIPKKNNSINDIVNNKKWSDKSIIKTDSIAKNEQTAKILKSENEIKPQQKKPLISNSFNVKSNIQNKNFSKIKGVDSLSGSLIDMPLPRIYNGIHSNQIIKFHPIRIKDYLVTEKDYLVTEKLASKKQAKKPNLTLGFIVAPDLTTVQRSGKSSLSGGLGIEATLRLSKRLSISTGATYAKKIYDSDFSLYNPTTNYVFKTQPTKIHANCDVLDIPLNVNYRLFQNSKYSIAVSTGLSSYIMLKEKYNYTYQNAYANGPESYTIKNKNQHIMGIANVGVTLQHKINNKISLGITPFVKVPLTKIGYGNAKLSSTGVAVSINMVDILRKKQ